MTPRRSPILSPFEPGEGANVDLVDDPVAPPSDVLVRHEPSIPAGRTPGPLPCEVMTDEFGSGSRRGESGSASATCASAIARRRARRVRLHARLRTTPRAGRLDRVDRRLGGARNALFVAERGPEWIGMAGLRAGDELRRALTGCGWIPRGVLADRGTASSTRSSDGSLVGCALGHPAWSR